MIFPFSIASFNYQRVAPALRFVALEKATKGSAMRFSCTPVHSAAIMPKPSSWRWVPVQPTVSLGKTKIANWKITMFNR